MAATYDFINRDKMVNVPYRVCKSIKEFNSSQNQREICSRCPLKGLKMPANCVTHVVVQRQIYIMTVSCIVFSAYKDTFYYWEKIKVSKLQPIIFYQDRRINKTSHKKNASVWSISAAFKYWLQIHLGELCDVTAESTGDLKNFLPSNLVQTDSVHICYFKHTAFSTIHSLWGTKQQQWLPVSTAACIKGLILSHF